MPIYLRYFPLFFLIERFSKYLVFNPAVIYFYLWSVSQISFSFFHRVLVGPGPVNEQPIFSLLICKVTIACSESPFICGSVSGLSILHCWSTC